MKQSFFLFLTIISGLAIHAQQYTTTSIKAGENLTKYKDYRFPAFKDGMVKFKTGGTLVSKMNFSKLSCQMEFIDPDGDTLALAKPEEILSIQIDSSVFYYSKWYTEYFADYDGVKLSVLRKVSFQTVNIGAMGVRSKGTSMINYSGLIGQAGNRQLLINEDIDADKVSSFFITLVNGEELAASKANFIKIFKPEKKDIEHFIKMQKIDFYKEADLKKLLIYCIHP